MRFLRNQSLGGGENMKKSESAKQTEALDNNILVGYVRRSNAGGALKLSINTAAFADLSLIHN
mgnify:FL=1